MVEAVVMEKVYGIIEGGTDMQSCGGNVVCVQLVGTQVDLG